MVRGLGVQPTLLGGHSSTYSMWEKIYHANINQKNILLKSAKVYFRAKNINKDKEGNFILSKSSTHKGDVKILNIYIPYKRYIYTKQTLIELEGEIYP